MPTEKNEEMTGVVSWADAVEQEMGGKIPEVTEHLKDGVKTRIEVMVKENGDKVKITSTFKFETKRVAKPIADRKKLRKFGASAGDPPGPNPATTYPSDEIMMQFIRNRAGELEVGQNVDGDPFDKLKTTGAGMHCRFCKQKDHFSINCPYKEQLEGLQTESDEALGGLGPSAESQAKVQDGKYVPPSLRAGAPVKSATMDRGRDENTVRVTNLPEDTTDQDLRDLFSNCGRVNRIFLAKDKPTGRSKGFAFVTYERREDAEKAILTVSGHRYGYVILKVEWAKQSN